MKGPFTATIERDCPFKLESETLQLGEQ